MGYSFWIILLTAISLSASVDICTKEAECVASGPIKIDSSPRGSSVYRPPSPISLTCDVLTSRKLKDFYWIRNNSDGDSITLNNTSDGLSLSNIQSKNLEDSPPEDKFPYTYQCVAIGECCEVVMSASKTVTLGQPTTPPISKKTELSVLAFTRKPDKFNGYGKLQLECTGRGDNTTTVEWIKTDKDGNNVTLNILPTFHTSTITMITIWRAFLVEKPGNLSKFPYQYQCVVKNRCCQTKMKQVEVAYIPITGCPALFGVLVKPMKINPVESKRSVKFTWVYDPDPEDTGFRFIVVEKNLTKDFNITEREFVVHGLVPHTPYTYNYRILYGDSCETGTRFGKFKTLPDDPGTPEDVTVQIVNGNSLNVSWLPPKQPNGEIESYTVYWKKADDDSYMKKNVKSNFYLIEDLEDLGWYLVKVEAMNSVGSGNSSVIVSVQLVPPESGNDGLSAGAIAGAVIGTILFILLLLMLIFFARKKFLRNQHEKSVREFGQSRPEMYEVSMGIVPSEEDNPQTEAEPLSANADFTEDLSYIVLLEDWEIVPDKLKLLDKKLGGGQFGVVRQGLLTTGKDDPEIVAVKMLKDGASESDWSDLKSELIILKEVNKISHPNVIKLIGGCSIAGKLHVITEFCPGGSLRHVLLNSRVYPTEENSANYINLASTLNHRQLLKIAADIASGMVHLSSQQFVHRDLAARNILIGVDNMAKISDFGLARDVSGAEEYIRNNQNLLPVKWMALESLLYGRFTSASDVWSYGVLLHEITTLGDEPYQNISPYNIVSHVGSGCRMSQPQQCSDEVYAIMTKCWQNEPTDRPTFEEIHELLCGMLMDNEKSYINVTQIIDEGSVSGAAEPESSSVKDGAVRYTH